MKLLPIRVEFLALVPTVLAHAQIPLIDEPVQYCRNEQSLSSASLQCHGQKSTETGERSSDRFLSNLRNGQEDKESIFSSWTHAPICTQVLEGIGSELCIYTNASFANGRGITFFTTPEIAQEITSLLVFQGESMMKKSNINKYSDLWYQSVVEGKGTGVLAKRRLNQAHRLMTYTPAFVAYFEQTLSVGDREALWRLAIDQLPPATRDNYYKLATVYGKPDIIAQDVVQANNFNLQLGGHRHLSVFPETSRLNHDCAPNAQYALDSSSLTHTVQATRDIDKDEEITIAYTDPLETTARRQELLSHGFHFTCTCARCSDKMTDTYLAEIRHVKHLLDTWETRPKSGPILAESLINMFKWQGLEGFLDVPYGCAAIAYNSIGDYGKAKQYASKAIKAMQIKDGPRPPNMEMFDELRKNPQKHWSWMYRPT